MEKEGWKEERENINQKIQRKSRQKGKNTQEKNGGWFLNGISISRGRR